MSQKLSWAVRAAGVVTVVGMLAFAGIAYAQDPTFSQTNVTVGSGQSISITSENGTGVYTELNSASNIVSVTVNGTQITLTGLSPGFATLNMCAVGTASDCTDLYVTVQTGAVSSLTLSSNNLSLSVGGNQSISVSGGDGTYSISSNSNTSVASTNLSGSSITINGLAAGTDSIKVCDGTGNVCGTLSVTVGSSSSSGLTFNPSSVSLAVNADASVGISGGNGSYNITGNSNPSVASVGLSSSAVIVVDGLEPGNSTITLCDTSTTNVCGTLSVSVGGSTTSSSTTTTTSNQGVSFSVTNPTLTVGQTLDVTLAGGATTYIVFNNGTSNVAQATMTGNSTLALTGLSAGTDQITMCAVGGGCGNLNLTVTGSGTATTPTNTSTVSPAVPITPIIPTTTVTPSVTVVPNTSLLSEIQAVQNGLSQALAQIQSLQTEINQIEAQVNAGSAGVTVGASANTSAGSGTFTELLAVGSEDAQVTALQNTLTSLGYYSGPITGYYGTLTENAVMKYQTAHGIAATGSVGPATRTALNAGN